MYDIDDEKMLAKMAQNEGIIFHDDKISFLSA